MNAFIFSTKGALKNKLQKKKKTIIVTSFLILFSIAILQVLINEFYNIQTYYIISLLWIFCILIIPHQIDKIPFKYLKYIIMFPFLFFINIIYGLMILYYQKDYPNIDEKHADRYRKIKRIIKKC